MTDEPAPTFAAGWYPDVHMANTQRYYDGTGWTEHRAPLADVGASAAQAATPSSDSTDALAFIGFLSALVFPLLGFILGIVLFAKDRAGAGLLCVLVSVAAGYGWYYYVLSGNY